MQLAGNVKAENIEKFLIVLCNALFLCGSSSFVRTLVLAGAKVQDEAPVLDHHNHPPHNNNDNQVPTPNLSTTQAEIVSVDSNNVEDNNNNNNSNNNSNNQARQLDKSAASVLSHVHKSLLMTVLTLTATATYQAVLSPPSGLWQDNDSDAKPPHVAGKSVLATNDPRGFVFFAIGNSTGLLLSFNSILLLTNYHYTLSVTLYVIITFTYSISVASITPDDGHLKIILVPILVLLAIILPFVNSILWRSPQRRTRRNLNP